MTTSRFGARNPIPSAEWRLEEGFGNGRLLSVVAHVEGHVSCRYMHSILRVLVLLGGLMVGTPARAFLDGGHRVVALMAWQQLTPASQDKLLRTLAAHPRFETDFLRPMPAALAHGRQTERSEWLVTQAGVWPDLARDMPQFHRGNWHFVNLPLFLSRDDAEELGGQRLSNTDPIWQPSSPDEGLNALQALDKIRRQFRFHTPQQQALDLCWVIHIVGDLHQPLHCVALYDRQHFRRGDKGGNSIKILPGRVLSSPPTTLHIFWDGLLGSRLNHNEVKRRSFDLLSNPIYLAEARTRASIQVPLSWAQEGAGYADVYAYPAVLRQAIASIPAGQPVEGIVLPPNYAQVAGAIAQQRAVIAAFRLAHALEALLR